MTGLSSGCIVGGSDRIEIAAKYRKHQWAPELTLTDVLGAPVLDRDAVEPSYRKARAALQSETSHVK